MSARGVDPRSGSADPHLSTLADPARVAATVRLLTGLRATALDRFAALAAHHVDAPHAEVILLTDRQVIGGRHGSGLAPDGAREASLDGAFCVMAAAQAAALAVDDATVDPRLAPLAAVRSGQVGCYLGVPLVATDHTVGTLSIYGPTPRAWSPADVQVATAIAAAIATELELSSLAAEAAHSAVRLDVGLGATDRRAGGEHLSRLPETMSSAFIGLDPEWRFTYVNTEAARLLGRRREELLGHSIWDEFSAARGTTFEERFRYAARTGEAVSVDEYYPPLAAWFEVRAWPTPDGLSVFFHDISERHAAQDERARALERLELLSSAGSRLSATLEVDEVIDLLDDLLLPRFGRWLAVAVGEDVAAVLGERETGRQEELRIVHVGAEEGETRRALAATLLDVPVSRDGHGSWSDAARAAIGAVLRGGDDPAPLARTLDSRGRTIGAIIVGDPAADAADHDLLSDIATRAGVALDNAMLYGAERRAGLALQHFLLPAQLPQLPGIATAARYLPGTAGRAIGGDFYIGHDLGDGRLLLAIGDVMGHGMQAAARMGQLRAVLTAYAYDGDEPGQVLGRVAQRADDLLDVRMATVALLVYDPVARRLSAASAGHPPPLLAPRDDAPRFLDLPPGPPIGAGQVRYDTVAVDVPADSTVVLYTDGLIENRGEPIDHGFERLRDALADVRLAPDAVCDHLLDALDRADGGPDDVAMLVLSHAAGVSTPNSASRDD